MTGGRGPFTVDEDKCCAAGTCVLIAPEVFVDGDMAQGRFVALYHRSGVTVGVLG